MPGDSVFIHSALVRIRAVGSGDLDLQMQGYDTIDTQDLEPITLQGTQNRERDRLCNFISQATKVKVSMDVKDEWFNINSIIIFIKQQWTSYPGID